MKLSFVGAGLALIYPSYETNYPLATNRFRSRFFVEHPHGILPPVSRRCRRSSGGCFAPMCCGPLFTIPNMQWWDREDDLAIGIKSTAILFGDMDVRVIALLQCLCLFAFWRCGRRI